MSLIESFRDAWNAAVDHYALRSNKAPKPAKGQRAFDWDESQHPRQAKNAPGGHGGEFRPVLSGAQTGLVKPTKTNEEAKAGDQLGLFGEAAKPKREGPATIGLKPGESTKGKQQALFDTGGNANQMDLFGDGIMPEDLVAKESRQSKPFHPTLLGNDLFPKAKENESEKAKTPEENSQPLIPHEETGPIPFRDRRAFADKLAQAGKTHQEIFDAMRARGVAAADARRHAAMALGDKAQSATPGPPAATGEPKTPKAPPETPAEKASDAFEIAIDSGKTAREAAAAAQKKLDDDYEFARASDVRNAGEDLKGSARHKVNAWKNLADAEENGTAHELVTRDNLLKNEPHDLIIHADRNPLTALAMHYALRSFPAKPGTKPKGDGKKDREQYLDAYRSIKEKAEQLAKTKDNTKALDAVAELQKHVGGLIDKYRGVPPGGSAYMGTDKYNQTANDLVALHKSLQSGWRANKTGVAGRMNEFSKALGERYGADWAKKGAAAFGGIDEAESVMDSIAGHAKDVMEGKSLNHTFGREGKEVNRFNPAEMYVKIADRKGGRDLSKVTADANKATKHLVDNFGMRGVQWGNSVTDDERKHHAAKAVEALTDLADTLGLHPKDIAIDGKLGLAIGARGRGGAVAHYEPGTQVINLTRANGVGSLAHEWGHAFDHALNGFDNKRFMSDDTNTHEIRQKSTGNVPNTWKSSTSEPERMEKAGYVVSERPLSKVRKAFADLETAQRDYRTRLAQKLQEDVNSGWMSEKKANAYWNSNVEIFARTFERYVQHKIEADGRKNTYLAGIETKGHKAGGYWPTDEEVKAMAPGFDAIFEAYRKEKHGSPEKVKFSRQEAIDAYASHVYRPFFERIVY